MRLGNDVHGIAAHLAGVRSILNGIEMLANKCSGNDGVDAVLDAVKLLMQRAYRTRAAPEFGASIFDTSVASNIRDINDINTSVDACDFIVLSWRRYLLANGVGGGIGNEEFHESYTTMMRDFYLDCIYHDHAARRQGLKLDPARARSMFFGLAVLAMCPRGMVCGDIHDGRVIYFYGIALDADSKLAPPLGLVLDHDADILDLPDLMRMCRTFLCAC